MTGKHSARSIARTAILVTGLVALVVAGCSREEQDVVSPGSGPGLSEAPQTSCEVVNGDFSQGFTGWTDLSEGPGLAGGDREIIDVDGRSDVLHLDSRASGNYYLFYIQRITVCGILNGTLTWDWKLAQIERSYGLAAVYVKFFDSSSELMGQYFVRRDTGDFPEEYDCSHIIAEICGDHPGTSVGCERLTGTAFGWETHTIDFTADFFDNLECNPLDPSEIESMEIWIESYNNAGSGVDAYFDDFVYTGSVVSLHVPFDIKPRSCPNPLNPKSHGVLPAAILGRADLDVRDIDLSSVRLEGVQPLRTGIEDVSRPAGGMEECGCTTEGPDGFDDLTLKFDSEEIVRVLGVGVGDGPTPQSGKGRTGNGPNGVEGRYTRVLAVTGRLLDGTPFEGRDCVMIFGEEPKCLEAVWLFEQNGADETGSHPCTLYGGAGYAVAPEGWGLRTTGPADYATYSPPIPQMEAGEIVVAFQLDAPFFTMPSYGNPIIIINSNRDGHNVGDMSVRLDPTDGKLWLVQENAFPSWTLKTNKASWAAGTWYEVSVRWGAAGRRIEVRWDGGSDMVSDTVVSPCFSSGATLTTIGSRAGDSPVLGFTIDRLEVRCDIGRDSQDVAQYELGAGGR